MYEAYVVEQVIPLESVFNSKHKALFRKGFMPIVCTYIYEKSYWYS